MIGQKLKDRYEVTTRLGKGAMGTVYRATDTQNGQEVAIKVISSELAVDAEALERFKREGEALRKLKHPNIVEFLDAFQHEEHYVIVMEYVSGGSLHDLISMGKLPVARASRIALELCDALIRAHHLNIIHRDLKPENILMDEDGTPKLADFGVARLSEGTRMTRSGTQVGTPYYMSPEAWEGQTLDAQADIWSLGVILFEMLTGRVPFGGDTGAAVMNKVLTTQPPDLQKLRTEVPPALAQVIKRMLTRDKKRRYPTMRQLAAELEQGQLAVTGASMGAKSPHRWPVLIGLGLILATSAVWLLTQYQGVQPITPIIGLTNTPTSIARREPSMTPFPSNTSTPIPSLPLIANLGQVVFNESFDDTDFPFTVPGLSHIESGVLVLEGTGNGFYSSFLVQPDNTTIILFKTTSGAQFNMGYHTGGYGTETLRRFSFESSGSKWELYEGNVDANGGNVPIKRWQSSPLQFDTWHYFLLTRSANGDIDAKIFERDNPQNMMELHENLGSEWGHLPLSSFIDFRLGSILLDEYQDIQPSGELASQTTPTPTGELVFSDTSINQDSAIPTSNLSSSNVLLEDHFDNQNFDGSYNDLLWNCGDCLPEVALQQNGVFTIKIASSSEPFIPNLGSLDSWTFAQAGYVEARLKLENYEGSRHADVHVQLWTDFQEYQWWTSCDVSMEPDSAGQGNFNCHEGRIYPDGSGTGGYSTSSIPIDTNEWQTVRIEIEPETFRLNFYLNGDLIGTRIPSDADSLKTKSLTAIVGIWTEGLSSFTAYLDDVIVGSR